MSENLPEKIKLPTLTELIEDTEMSLKENKLTFLLNQPPPENWIKENNGVKYLPRERHEFLLTKIYGSYKLEVKSVQLFANSVVVTVRLHVVNPISGVEEWQDGIGATPIQTNKGAGAMDWNQAKHNGVQLAAPSAETYAMKDAAEKFGKIFGRDLSLKQQVDYTSILKEDIVINEEELNELFHLKKDSLSDSDLSDAMRIVKNKEKNSYRKLFNKLKSL